MYIVKRLNEFDKWLNGLKDRPTKIRLIRRLDKARQGLLGDIKPVGERVFKMREFFGSGWPHVLHPARQHHHSDAWRW